MQKIFKLYSKHSCTPTKITLNFREITKHAVSRDIKAEKKVKTEYWTKISAEILKMFRILKHIMQTLKKKE